MSNFKEFPCPNCSSELNYDAEKKGLKCLHCHSLFPIKKSNEIIEEKSIAIFRDAISLQNNQVIDVVYKCSKCGQENKTEGVVAFLECKNCGNNAINPEAYKTKTITPSCIIPFTISKDKAMEIFVDWIGKGFWNDNSLKELSIADKLVGEYIPFWTFDAKTSNNWSGQSGTYYYTERSYRDKNGETRTETVRKTRWSYREGQFDHFFDDILICGNKKIGQDYINKIYPYNLEMIQPMTEEYLLGWESRAFDKDMNESYDLSKEYMNERINAIAAEHLRDDTYSDLIVNTHFYEETFKHIVLPIWFCDYLFKGKNYYFIINGQTGAIHGDKPLSKSKIIVAILLGLLFLFILTKVFF
jgi:DNA-directed RNA polymerase subunit RPC12/RpoP